MPEWNAEQYSKFQKERTLPAIELARSLPARHVRTVLDVGCGIGNSTAAVKERFPDATVLGVDRSDEMLAAARKHHPDLAFRKLDAETELASLPERYDVVFSNACLQWVPDHRRLFPQLMALLNENGTLAVQIPQQDKHPMHRVIQRVAASEKWARKLPVSRVFHTLTEEAYFDLLAELSARFRMWETVYFHAMPSHQSILEWYKGTGLRPFLEQLDEGDKAEFEKDVLTETEKTYPVQPNGEIIFRFPRLFMTAVRTR